MSTTAGKVLLGDGPGDAEMAIGQIKEFLKGLGNVALGEVPDLAKEEMKKRLDLLEQQAAAMKRHFDGVVGRPIGRKPHQNQRSVAIVDKPKGTKRLSNARHPGDKKKLTEVIKNVLATGPKSRAEIGRELTAQGLSTPSLGTLLSRMKKNNAINHDVDTKSYSLSEATLDHSEVVFSG